MKRFSKLAAVVLGAALVLASFTGCPTPSGGGTSGGDSPAITLSCETATVWKGDKITGTVVFSNFENTPATVDLYVEGEETGLLDIQVTDGKFTVNTTNLNAGTHKVYVKSGSVESNHISITINEIPEGFVKVAGTTFDGTSTLTPESKVFISGRSLTIGGLWVSDHEVTRGEYKALIGSDPSTAKAYDKDGNELTGEEVLNNPVNTVSWYDAIVYCNKLSIKEGLTPCYTIFDSTAPDEWGTVPTSSNSTWNAATCDFDADGYRLPTEAEWEWLARGGEDYTYAGSDTVGDVAWYTSNTNDTGTREVKTKVANGYGLYDMSGNVYEWCWDWYGSISSSTGASGASSGSYRVHRGGSWYRSDVNFCEVAKRYGGNPYNRALNYGFRLVRSAQ